MGIIVTAFIDAETIFLDKFKDTSKHNDDRTKGAFLEILKTEIEKSSLSIKFDVEKYISPFSVAIFSDISGIVNEFLDKILQADPKPYRDQISKNSSNIIIWTLPMLETAFKISQVPGEYRQKTMSLLKCSALTNNSLYREATPEELTRFENTFKKKTPKEKLIILFNSNRTKQLLAFSRSIRPLQSAKELLDLLNAINLKTNSLLFTDEYAGPFLSHEIAYQETRYTQVLDFLKTDANSIYFADDSFDPFEKFFTQLEKTKSTLGYGMLPTDLDYDDPNYDLVSDYYTYTKEANIGTFYASLSKDLKGYIDSDIMPQLIKARLDWKADFDKLKIAKELFDLSIWLLGLIFTHVDRATLDEKSRENLLGSEECPFLYRNEPSALPISVTRRYHSTPAAFKPIFELFLKAADASSIQGRGWLTTLSALGDFTPEVEQVNDSPQCMGKKPAFGSDPYKAVPFLFAPTILKGYIAKGVDDVISNLLPSSLFDRCDEVSREKSNLLISYLSNSIAIPHYLRPDTEELHFASKEACVKGLFLENTAFFYKELLRANKTIMNRLIDTSLAGLPENDMTTIVNLLNTVPPEVIFNAIEHLKIAYEISDTPEHSYDIDHSRPKSSELDAFVERIRGILAILSSPAASDYVSTRDNTHYWTSGDNHFNIEFMQKTINNIREEVCKNPLLTRAKFEFILPINYLAMTGLYELGNNDNIGVMSAICSPIYSSLRAELTRRAGQVETISSEVVQHLLSIIFSPGFAIEHCQHFSKKIKISTLFFTKYKHKPSDVLPKSNLDLFIWEAKERQSLHGMYSPHLTSSQQGSSLNLAPVSRPKKEAQSWFTWGLSLFQTVKHFHLKSSPNEPITTDILWNAFTGVTPLTSEELADPLDYIPTPLESGGKKSASKGATNIKSSSTNDPILPLYAPNN